MGPIPTCLSGEYDHVDMIVEAILKVTGRGLADFFTVLFLSPDAIRLLEQGRARCCPHHPRRCSPTRGEPATGVTGLRVVGGGAEVS